jgi:predicted PurR-regulated permease PerM
MSQDWKKLIVSIIIVFVIQTIDGNIVNPKLLSHAVKVHPMLVIIALLLGSKIGGLAGMILAVPVAALLKLWLDRWIGIMEAGKLRQKG